MASVDRGFFDVLGVQPIVGGFTAEDFDRVAGESDVRLVRPVLLGHGLWRTLTGGDTKAVGQTRVISERGGKVFAFRIAGVLPESFVFPLEMEGGEPDLITPTLRNAGLEMRRDSHVVLRVPQTVDIARLRARLDGAAALVAKSAPAAPHGAPVGEGRVQAPFDRLSLDPLRDWLGVRQRDSSHFLFWSALGLLLVACFNGAALAAARNMERRGQLLLCRALGASMGELAKLQLVEVGVLAVTAAALSFVLAKALLVETIELLPDAMVLGAGPSIAGRALIATILFTFLSVLVVSTWPLFVASRFGLPALGRRGPRVRARSQAPAAAPRAR